MSSVDSFLNQFCISCGNVFPYYKISHHTSYNPEKILEICPSCHSKIHSRDDFKPNLTPDMSRGEAVMNGYIDNSLRLNIRLKQTQEDINLYKWIDNQSKQRGMSLSEFIKNCIIYVRDMEEDNFELP